MMGAIAFQKDLGSVHACAHALGAVCDMHHGLANALMIDTVLAWNHEAVPARSSTNWRTWPAWPAAALPSCPGCKHLKPQVGITGGLAAHGVTPEHAAAPGAAGRGRLHRPDQPAPGHRGRLRAPVPAGDVTMPTNPC
jgi:alcohol dehydrogenase class IV